MQLLVLQIAVGVVACEISRSAANPSLVSINLGNTLEAPFAGMWAPAAQEYYFDDFKTAGFEFVRIPVRWDNHTSWTPPYTIDSSFLDRVQEVVGWSLARGFTTLINSHHDDWIDNEQNFESSLPRFISVWTQVAQRFSSSPASLLFEVYNEPHVMNVTQLNEMNAHIYATIRQTNPTRTILIGGLEWMGPNWILQNPDAMVIPDNGNDPNLMLEIHDYDPGNFTGTGQKVTVYEWGTAAEQAVVSTMATNIHQWSTNHYNLPVLLGEFGCSKPPMQPNEADRALWYATYAKAVTASSFFAFSIWDDDGQYQTYNRATRTWDQNVLTAIFSARK